MNLDSPCNSNPSRHLKWVIFVVAIIGVGCQRQEAERPFYINSANLFDSKLEKYRSNGVSSRVISDVSFNDQSPANIDYGGGNDGRTFNDYPLPVRDPQWPRLKLNVGEASGVSVDSRGNPFLLHRGDRKWERGSFNGPHFAHKNQGAIKDNVLVKLDPKDGKIVQYFFSNTFFMPHGLTIDPDDNIWITDVALHQVFKYSRGNFRRPSLVLGKKFEPGSDAYHFCQPTDVAVASNGQFFVSDGYCNNRIIKYDRNGDVIAIVGKSVPGAWYDPPLAFSLPHGLTLLEQADMICVADRETFRVVCLRAGVVILPGQASTPNSIDLFRLYSQRQPDHQPSFLSYRIVDLEGRGIRPYAIANLAPSNNIYVITQPNELKNGRDQRDYSETGPSFMVNKQLQIDTTWFSFPSSSRPHDLAIFNSTDLYVADLDMGIWKFTFNYLTY